MSSAYLAFYVCACLFLAFSTALISFLMWIVYAETSCQLMNSMFPVKGYSWGWICMIVATFLYLLAMLLAYLGLLKILTFKPFIPNKLLCGLWFCSVHSIFFMRIFFGEGKVLKGFELDLLTLFVL